jgi:hypothetical protein
MGSTDEWLHSKEPGIKYAPSMAAFVADVIIGGEEDAGKVREDAHAAVMHAIE